MISPMSATVQCASGAFMVCPRNFGFNAQTASSNVFQQLPPAASVDATAESELAAAARVESQALCQALRSEGVQVLLAEDEAMPAKPDAVFPNNWLSLHGDGTLVLYPLLAANRRLERRAQLVEAVCEAFDFRPRRRIDLTAHEAEGRFLEGTGSLVLDHVARVAYACESPRTDPALVHEWARLMGFEAVIFDATDAQGRAYYHTNVMLWIGSRATVLCTEALAESQRANVRARLLASGRELIEIDRAAVAAFAGNLLELASWDEALGDCSLLVMSASARAALAGESLQRLSACVDTILAVPVPCIERVGGGSVRCMLTEVPHVAAELGA